MTKTEQTRLRTWRFKVLQRAGESSRNVAGTCRHFGISRQAFYKWKRRFAEFGADGLYDRPRVPHRSPRAMGRSGGDPYERLVAKTRAELSARSQDSTQRLTDARNSRLAPTTATHDQNLTNDSRPTTTDYLLLRA